MLWWYIAPIIPGVLVSVVGSIPGRLELQYLPRMAPFLVLVVGVFAWIVWANKAAAARLDRQIEELNRLEKLS